MRSDYINYNLVTVDLSKYLECVSFSQEVLPLFSFNKALTFLAISVTMSTQMYIQLALVFIF